MVTIYSIILWMTMEHPAGAFACTILSIVAVGVALRSLED